MTKIRENQNLQVKTGDWQNLQAQTGDRQNPQVQTEDRQNGQSQVSLQQRLSLFFISLAVFLILAFVLLLLLFGINGRDERALKTYFANELEHLSNSISRDFGQISADGLTLAAEAAEEADVFFYQHGITADRLPEHPELLEPLLADQMQRLLNIMENRTCGGVFLLLDATVRPEAKNSENFKAGIFLKKTQPAVSAAGVKTHCLRGPAQVARDNGVGLLGQWTMEFDITGEPFFKEVMDRARSRQELPLSRLYYWTSRVTLKGNSEAGFLLCVPLRSRDGVVFGLCGIEVSDRMFKQLYSPGDRTYKNTFTIAAPFEAGILYTEKGMIAGNDFLTSRHLEENLTIVQRKNDLEGFLGEGGSYSGARTSLRLYPAESPYADQSWLTAVVMPDSALYREARGSFYALIAITVALLLLSLILSMVISRYCLWPVNHALDAIRNNTYGKAPASGYTEITDLFEFLKKKDQEHEQELLVLEQLRQEAAALADSAQTELSRMADKKQREVDPDAYEQFTNHLVELTPRERQVFALYLDGKTAKEIVEELGFSVNALKYHNRNIYEKLGVSSRKELLLYAALMKYQTEKKGEL